MHKVLLVDDEIKVLEGMCRFFDWESAGFKVSATACSYDEAIDRVKENPVDLVLTDISMPGKNGIDLIRTLKKLTPETFIIILSAYSEFSYAQEALRLGALDYLTKPINFSQLGDSLNKAKIKIEERNPNKNGDISRQLYASRLMNLLSGYPAKNDRANRPLITSRTAVLRICPLSITDSLSPKTIELLRLALSPATVLATGDREITFVCHNAERFETLVENIENCIAKNQLFICCGLSKQVKKDGALRKAYMQAGRAMRYQRAREKYGLMAYHRLEHIFSGIDGEREKAMQRMIENFTLTDTRNSLPDILDAYLDEMQQEGVFSLHDQQKFCAALAIELDAAAQRYALTNHSRREALSAFLLEALSCKEEAALRAAAKRYLKELVSSIATSETLDESTQLVERVKAYLDEHFSQNITLDLLAENFFISPVYLSRLFKKKTGENYIRYLTKLRLNKAQTLLITTKMKVSDVACMIGYDNPRYFARLFKEHYGMNPQEYRERQNNAN
ncbi:MAG: response regulator [Eubacteriales bacterium]|nr:response regulator [Eubacteriales bacterium]